MTEWIEDITPEDLGPTATNATAAQFRRACEAAITAHPGIWNVAWLERQAGIKLVRRA